MKTPFVIACLSYAAFIFQAAGAVPGQYSEPKPRARISPSVMHVEPGRTQAFKIVLKATRLWGARLAEDVQWSVNNIPGGNEILGTIDENGLYTAPAETPSPREIHICARVPEARNPLLWATVLMPSPGPAYELVEEWGEEKKTSKHFVDPHCLSLDKVGNLLIADYQGSMVSRWTPEGEFLGLLGLGTGEGPGQVVKPRVVQVDDEGRIFVSDQKTDKPRIQVFSHEGEFERIFAPKGTGPGHVLRAHGLVFDASQNLYVVDVDNMRISIFEHGGDFVKYWGQDGMRVGDFNAPHGIAMDANEDVFIVGYYGPCQKFTKDGEFLFDFAHGDPPDNAVYFHNISSDQWGNIYLMVRGQRGYGGALEDTDGNTKSIDKYNNNGDYVCSLTLKVKEHSENWAVVDESGLVYSIFQSSDRMGVQIFAPR